MDFLQISQIDQRTITLLTDTEISSISFCLANTIFDIDDQNLETLFILLRKLSNNELDINTKGSNIKHSNASTFQSSIDFLLNSSIKCILSNKSTIFKFLFDKIEIFNSKKDLLLDKYKNIQHKENLITISYSDMEDFTALIIKFLQEKNSITSYKEFKKLVIEKILVLKQKSKLKTYKTDYDFLLELETIKAIKFIIDDTKEILFEVFLIFFCALNCFFPSLLKIEITPSINKIDNYINKINKKINFDLVEQLSEYYRTHIYYNLFANCLISKLSSVQSIVLNIQNSYFIECSYAISKGSLIAYSYDNSKKIKEVKQNDYKLKIQLQNNFNKDNNNTIYNKESIEIINFSEGEENELVIKENREKAKLLLSQREYLKTIRTIIDPYLIGDGFISYTIKFNSLDCVLFERINQLVMKNTNIVELSFDLFNKDYEFSSFFRKLLLESNLEEKGIVSNFTYDDMYFNNNEIARNLFKLFNENMNIFGINIQRKLKSLSNLKLCFNIYEQVDLDSYITCIIIFIRNLLLSLSVYKEMISLVTFELEANITLNLDYFPTNLNLNSMKIKKLSYNVNTTYQFFNLLLPIDNCVELEMRCLTINQFEIIKKLIKEHKFKNMKILIVGFNYEYLCNKDKLKESLYSFITESKGKLFEFKMICESLFSSTDEVIDNIIRKVSITDAILKYEFKFNLFNTQLLGISKLCYKLHSCKFILRLFDKILLKYNLSIEAKKIMDFLIIQEKVILIK